LAGCGVLILVFAGVIAGLTWFGMRKGKQMLVTTAVDVASQALDETQLPEDQKEKLIERIQAVGDDVLDGDITIEQLVEIAQRMGESPAVIAGGALYFIETEILDKAPIDDELRKAAKRAVQRLARGVVEESIELEQLESIADDFTEERPDGKRVVKSDFSKEDVEKLIAAATELADEADVPDEAYEVDLAAEIDQIVEDVTGIPSAENNDDSDQSQSDASAFDEDDDNVNSDSNGAPEADLEPAGSP
jgi:hypothetical protein